MDPIRDRLGTHSRRAVLGTLIGVGVAGASFSPAGDIIEQFAPLSGKVWEAATPDRPRTVQSPHGEATLRYDEEGVPHIEADDEQALYYAAGHTQAIDRGFQMDLQRRLFSGRLAEIVGKAAVESDRFHRKLAFREAAEATAEHLQGTSVQPVLEAFAEGVTDGFEDAGRSIGFQLLDYEPEPWTPVDSLLVEKIIAWQLTGDFRTLRRALARDRFGAERTAELFRNRLDHDVPIIPERYRDERYTIDGTSEMTTASVASPSRTYQSDQTAVGRVDTEIVEYLAQFEPRANLGSNSWVINAELAGDEGPILCNDPHLGLQAPPVWYEMHLDGPDHRVRGVAFPGVPEVVIGETEFAAWGFTNANTDVIDFYTYESDETSYQYDGEERSYDEREETIEVADGADETVTVRKTVHGPIIEEAEQEVAVSWTGHAATETMIALYELTRSSSFPETLDAIRKFESPTQNFLYADQDDNTLYYTVGRHPLRQPAGGEDVSWNDGEDLLGDQIFDGSRGAGEWQGFEPFTRPSWEGFVPFEQKPHVVNPPYLATANQEIIPDEELPYYFAAAYSDPYRANRIYDLLETRIESSDPVDHEFLQRVGRDIYDGRAASIVPEIVDAVRDGDEDIAEAAATLEEWEYRMDHEKEAPLIFHYWMEQYREEVLGERFSEAGLDEEYYPQDSRLIELRPDSAWFGSDGKETILRSALRKALAAIDDDGVETYGDIAHTGLIQHLSELDFLGYDSFRRSGSGWTVRNFGLDGPWGGSWEMQVALGGEYLGILPGGNSGRYFSEHYDDQLRRWANGTYRTISRDIEGDIQTEFVGGEQ